MRVVRILFRIYALTSTVNFSLFCIFHASVFLFKTEIASNMCTYNYIAFTVYEVKWENNKWKKLFNKNYTNIIFRSFWCFINHFCNHLELYKNLETQLEDRIIFLDANFLTINILDLGIFWYNSSMNSAK